MTLFRKCQCLSRRNGTTAVETAVVLPVFLTMLFGLLEYGHGQMVSNLLKSATRAGVRMGSTEGVTSQQAKDRVRQILAAGMNANAVSILVKNASVYDQTNPSLPTTDSQYQAMSDIELSSSQPRQLFLIRASVSYNSVALMPLWFLKNVTLTGQAFMRHE